MGFEKFYERFPTEASCFKVLRKIKTLSRRESNIKIHMAFGLGSMAI